MPNDLKSLIKPFQSDTEALYVAKRNNKKSEKVVDNTIVFWYYTKCQQVVDGKGRKETWRELF